MDKAYSKYRERKLPPEGLQAQLVKAQDAKAFCEILCDCYELKGNFTIDDIAAFVRDKRAQHPNHKLLGILDDFDQACYTSAHACSNHLREDEIEDLWDEDTDTSKLTFEIREKQFKKLLNEDTSEAPPKTLFWFEDQVEFSNIKTSPWTFRETFSYVHIVPVKSASQTLMEFPNGYFTSDYSPFQNFRLAEYLENNFSFELFGIGASYLGFERHDVLQDSELESLVNFLESLYINADASVIRDHLYKKLEGQRTFYFRYTDG